jgi:hypothetical protein
MRSSEHDGIMERALAFFLVVGFLKFLRMTHVYR